MNQANYSSATNGYVCVGTSTYNGNSNFMAAAYTYTGTGTFTAHSELATVSSPCPPGNAIANSSSYNLSQYQAAVVQWGPRNYSATWSGTGWHYNGGGYTDLGSVCGTW